MCVRKKTVNTTPESGHFQIHQYSFSKSKDRRRLAVGADPVVPAT